MLDETLLTFTEAAAALPRVGGRKPHCSTIWRWARKGIQGVRLESIRVGGRFLTSREALERFVRALAEVGPPRRPAAAPREDPPWPARPQARSDREREAAIERARQELAAAGI